MIRLTVHCVLCVLLAGCGGDVAPTQGVESDRSSPASVSKSLPDSASTSGEPVGAYEAKARATVAALTAGDTAAASKANAELMALAEAVFEQAKPKTAHCDAYLAASRGVMKKLDTITLDELERDYHKDGALPAAPGDCYHLKDLLVHPATVQVQLRATPADVAGMREEIEEVLEHLDIVRQLIAGELVAH